MCHHRHHHSHRGCSCGESPLLKVLAVGAVVYVGLKAFHHYQIYHRD